MTSRFTHLFVFAAAVFAGCASSNSLLGGKPTVPAEFNQKIILNVSDEVKMHQAPKSTYDLGDLQAFHVQHTLPIVVEEAFREIFGEVEILESKDMNIETQRPDVPAVFEVQMIDAAHDNYFDHADNYRAEVTLAVAMKSPRDEIFWQQAFRGEGYAMANNEFGQGLGPQDALVDALRDAVDQMQDAIVKSEQVRIQLKHYEEADQAREEAKKQVQLDVKPESGQQ